MIRDLRLCDFAVPCVVAFLLLGAGCEPPIPRPQDVTSPDAAQRARELAERSIALHGGGAGWDRLEDIAFTAHFEPGAGAPDATSAPTPTDIRFTMNFKHYHGRMDFPATPGYAWVHDGREAFFIDGGKLSSNTPGPDAMRIPMEAQLFSVPFRLLDAGVALAYVGLEKEGDRPLETVLVSPAPGSPGVQRRALAHFDPATAEVVHVSFDVGEREVGVAGDAVYLEWQTIQGLRLPKRIRVDTTRPTRIHVHDLLFTDVNLKPKVDPRAFEKPAAP